MGFISQTSKALDEANAVYRFNRRRRRRKRLLKALPELIAVGFVGGMVSGLILYALKLIWGILESP